MLNYLFNPSETILILPQASLFDYKKINFLLEFNIKTLIYYPLGELNGS